uniref:NOP2 nucleolar protein homolog (yeast) n=1 Tax=Neogobius melanostomus TaxID=47308 RepID=A0A8C6UP96_9GOBI
MGRKLDPTNKVKRGPGKKSRKQKGAETELAKFLTDEDNGAKRLSSRGRKRAAKRTQDKKPKVVDQKPAKGKQLHLFDLISNVFDQIWHFCKLFAS